MDPLTLIVSFLGGGILGALINWARAERSEKKDRQINFLDRQIRELYGPLYYFVTQAEKLFDLNDRLHKALEKAHKSDVPFSRDEGTQRILAEETDTTLSIANAYISYVESNNAKIKDVLDKNYPLIDPEDIEILLLFFEHYIRISTERDDMGKLKTPLTVYEDMGDISFLRPEFINRVKEKFFNKKKALKKLLEG